MPVSEQLYNIITLQDYNTRVVMVGSLLLGIAAGVVGTFMLLRKRALMADAVSHATLPGIGVAFLVMTAVGGSGKSLSGLLVGAVLSGLAGVGFVLFIRRHTKLKEDAALGIVLSVFFGLGIAILGVVQKSKTGNAAGLESFIYGKTASMLASDAWLICIAASLALCISTALYKEFKLLCFDQEFAMALGWPVLGIDWILMGLVVTVTVIGLQAVGLILVIALLIIPPAASRFWTHRLSVMVFLSALIGGFSCILGAALSALLPDLPAGAVIVVTAFSLFLVSMIFGFRRGVCLRWIEYLRLNRKIARQHGLRALFEWEEQQISRAMPWTALFNERSWSATQLNRLLKRLRREQLVKVNTDHTIELTDEGRAEAARMVRNHRLWEMYLITYADIAPSHVDRDADLIEHVLGPEIIHQLEVRFREVHPASTMPVSPHVIPSS